MNTEILDGTITLDPVFPVWIPQQPCSEIIGDRKKENIQHLDINFQKMPSHQTAEFVWILLHILVRSYRVSCRGLGELLRWSRAHDSVVDRPTAEPSHLGGLKPVTMLPSWTCWVSVSGAHDIDQTGRGIGTGCAPMRFLVVHLRHIHPYKFCWRKTESYNSRIIIKVQKSLVWKKGQ